MILQIRHMPAELAARMPQNRAHELLLAPLKQFHKKEGELPTPKQLAHCFLCYPKSPAKREKL